MGAFTLISASCTKTQELGFQAGGSEAWKLELRSHKNPNLKPTSRHKYNRDMVRLYMISQSSVSPTASAGESESL